MATILETYQEVFSTARKAIGDNLLNMTPCALIDYLQTGFRSVARTLSIGLTFLIPNTPVYEPSKEASHFQSTRFSVQYLSIQIICMTVWYRVLVLKVFWIAEVGPGSKA